MTITIGPFVTSEIPPPLVYTFEDSNGAAIDLSGYTGKLIVRRPDGTTVTYTSSVTLGTTNGKATFIWQPTTIAQKGRYHAEFWVDDTVNRFASDRLTWYARAALA